MQPPVDAEGDGQWASQTFHELVPFILALEQLLRTVIELEYASRSLRKTCLPRALYVRVVVPIPLTIRRLRRRCYIFHFVPILRILHINLF